MELLHQGLGNIHTRSLMAWDTEIFWQDIELRIDPDPFFVSCQISSMNKKAITKNPLKTKATFKWVFMDIIPATSSKRLTSESTFYNDLWIVYEYSKPPKLYGMEIITTEEVMDKLDLFQSRFGKIYEFLLVGFEKSFSRCRYAVYLHRAPEWMSNPQYYSYVSCYGESGN